MRVFLLLTLLAASLPVGCAPGPTVLPVESPYRDPSTLAKGEILHLPTGRLLTRDQLLELLAARRVVYVGETHDSVEDHGVELALLEGLDQRFPEGLALGLEMLRRPFQPQVDAYLAGDLDERTFVREVWSESWGPRSWPYYRDILRYARDNGIPVLALNAGNDLKDAVRDKGLEGLPPELAARLPEMGPDDPYQQAFLAGMFAGHEPGSGALDSFVRVQVLWEETMADTAARYLREPAGAARRLLVFAGGNHVRYGFGVPRRLFRRVPLPYVIVDPYAVEVAPEKTEQLMDVEVPALPLRPADVYWAVGYRDLEDRRVMLGVRIRDADGGGVQVEAVLPKSTAARAGLRAGDVIVAVDDVPVAEMFDLTWQVDTHRPGDTGTVEVEREGERLRLEVAYEVGRRREE
jgi:uncharacterized iron-regulated protein